MLICCAQRSKIILINQEIFYILTLNEEKGVFFVYGRGKRLSLSSMAFEDKEV